MDYLVGDDLDDLLDSSLIMGDYDDDDDFMVGNVMAKMRALKNATSRARRANASRGRGSSQGAAMARAIQQKRLQNATLVQESLPTKSREQLLGVQSLAVTAGAAFTASTQPQVAFKIKRFIISANNAAQWLITDIKVGKNSQFVNANAVPGDVFASTSAYTPELAFDTAQVSQLVQVSGTNNGLATADFRASFIGTALE